MKWGLILIGSLLAVNGFLVLKRKRFGPEEGMRGNIVKGKTAIFSGIALTIIGIVLIVLGLIFK